MRFWPSAALKAAEWAPWIWPGPCAPAEDRERPPIWRFTCWTRWSRSTAPRPREPPRACQRPALRPTSAPGVGTRCGSRLRFYVEALVPGACGWKAVGTTASTPKTWPRVDHRPTRLQALVNPTNVINAVQTFYPPAKRFARFSAIHGGKTGPPALLAGLNKTIANLSATPMKAGNPSDRVFQWGLRP